MQIVINNKGRINSKTAIKICEFLEGEKTSYRRKYFFVLLVLDILWLCFNLLGGIIFGAFLLGIYFYDIFYAVKRGRKYISSMDGLVISFYDNELRIGNNIFSYASIKHIDTVAGFLAIFIGDDKVIVKITDENGEIIKAAIKYIKPKLFKLSEKIIVSNPNKISLINMAKAWKKCARFSSVLIIFARDILFFSIIINLFRLDVVYSLLWSMFVLVVNGILFGVSVLLSNLQIKKYLGTSILFSDAYIEWQDKKIEYKHIREVIPRKNHLIINAKKDSMVIFCDQCNISQIAKIYEILQFKCSYRIRFNDESSEKKRGYVKLSLYGVLCMAICAFYFLQIIAYPSKLSQYKEKYEENYGIELHVLEQDSSSIGYSIDKQNNKVVVLEAIEGIDKVLDRFPSEFWEGLRDKTKIRIIVCDDIENRKEGGKRVDGFTSNLVFQIDVYIDSDVSAIEETIAHEMFHVLISEVENEDFISSSFDNIIDVKQWKNYNPKGFVYGNSRSEYKDKFVSAYAMTNVEEDMAETFSHLLVSDYDLPREYKQDNIQKKAKFLVEWIEENFDGISEDAYWNKWFK